MRILVAEIDIDLARLDGPGADQHPLEEAVRIGLEEIAVLEGSGLALVGIDRHEAWPGSGAPPPPATISIARVILLMFLIDAMRLLTSFCEAMV